MIFWLTSYMEAPLDWPGHALRVRLEEEDEGLPWLPPHRFLLRDNDAVPRSGVHAVRVHLQQIPHVHLFTMFFDIRTELYKKVCKT